MSGIELITPDWRGPVRVRAAFSLRTGGVSTAPFDSLNLGSAVGDDPRAVNENHRRLCERLSLPEEPAWLDQVHGTGVAVLDSLPAHGATQADAAVTRVPSRVCVVRVADCMPVLFAARTGEAVGAAHAGWRGLAAGVLEATVAAMNVRPDQLLAWMGPCIGATNFEVGDEVRAAFTTQGNGAAAAFARNPRGRWLCDLYALARARLTAMGVGAVSGGGWCTYADPARFYSFRRDGQTGRMAAFIWISAT